MKGSSLDQEQQSNVQPAKENSPKTVENVNDGSIVKKSNSVSSEVTEKILVASTDGDDSRNNVLQQSDTSTVVSQGSSSSGSSSKRSQTPVTEMVWRFRLIYSNQVLCV